MLNYIIKYMLGFLKKTKSNTYFDLSSGDRKKIVTGAVRGANAEQLKMVQEYDNQPSKYCKQVVR